MRVKCFSPTYYTVDRRVFLEHLVPPVILRVQVIML